MGFNFSVLSELSLTGVAITKQKNSNFYLFKAIWILWSFQAPVNKIASPIPTNPKLKNEAFRLRFVSPEVASEYTHVDWFETNHKKFVDDGFTLSVKEYHRHDGKLYAANRRQKQSKSQ